MRRTGPPSACTSPMPATTKSTCPSGCLCHAVRAPGSKLTRTKRTRDGSSPMAISSIQTVPVNQSSGPLRVVRSLAVTIFMGMFLSSRGINRGKRHCNRVLQIPVCSGVYMQAGACLRKYTGNLSAEMKPPLGAISLESVLETPGQNLEDVKTHAAGPGGNLPVSAEMLLAEPSGNLFGLTQGAGMGWEPSRLLDPHVLILSTHGGLRAENGTPIALGFHTGHWEVGLLVAEAARELKTLRAVPFAAACTDPCDGRTQGTTGMMDSLPFRNDAAIVLRRLIRSLPTRKGVIGVATCDKGLPAMMMALAASGKTPAVLIPGGGCQFLGTAATSQVVGEALGLSLPHTALAPSGQPIWLDMGARSARAI